MIDKIDLNYQPSNPIELSFTEELKVIDLLNEMCEAILPSKHEKELLQRFVSEYKDIKDKYDPNLADKVEELEEDIEDLESEIDEKKNTIKDLESEIDSLREENQELDSKCDLLTDEINLCRETMGD